MVSVHLLESLHESHLLPVKAFITFLVFNNSLLLCKLFLLNNVSYNSVVCITALYEASEANAAFCHQARVEGRKKNKALFFLLPSPCHPRSSRARREMLRLRRLVPKVPVMQANNSVIRRCKILFKMHHHIF